ncbi:hypothetical protein DL1_18440 [Thioclava dalianensis]|uniref:Uncharacterized protein n=1 Tax=Thioclava dalianensis TaxID=1185766 RepID=A0A074TFR8_9RHOB|nr:hypothetical protein [Thioclava dalianensis]KEP67868.1 hypothetical protein DL1_18440 [Thioclava dalianensis]SFN93960.1 hypothetical protein SAMN05216224_1324 [Thioclava dalianensis]
MAFFHTDLRNDTTISINMAQVENIYRDQTSQAVIVMLPTDCGQRVFEVAESYRDVADQFSVGNLPI